MKFMQYIIKSMVRRRKQIFRVSMAVFLSFIFITGILLFQENMYRWQMASSKEHFGDWFIMLAQSEKAEYPEVAGHPYLDAPKHAQTGSLLYDGSWEETEYRIGTMTEDFIRQGNITLDQGRMPVADNEIALDWNTILKLNVKPEIGSVVTIYTHRGNKDDDATKLTKDYTLVGIMNSYTNMWQNGSSVPGAIVTEKEFSEITVGMTDVYIFPLKSFVKTKDYEKVFESMKEQYNPRLVYNSSVYDYQPWESPLVYNYMYVLIMLIGIAAITYQVIGYQRSRQETLQRLEQLGATKGQQYLVTFVENIVILLVSGLLGFVVAVFVGKGICGYIEVQKGVSIYVLSVEVMLKTILSMVTAIAVEEVTGFWMHGKRTPRAATSKGKNVSAKQQLSQGNYIRETHRRFVHGNGILHNLLVRVFAAAMATIMVVCFINVYTAFRSYTSNNEQIDFIGFLQEDDGVDYSVDYILDQDAYFANNGKTSVYEMLDSYTIPRMSLEEWEEVLFERYYPIMENGRTTFNDTYYLRRYYMGKGGVKKPNTSLDYGVKDSLIEDINNIAGVEEVQYAYYETERNWRWDHMDYEQIGIERYGTISNDWPVKNPKYLYATEYVEPTEALYELLKPYLEPDQINYEAFKNGEQVLVIEDTNSTGVYDDSMQAGVSLELMNYSNFIMEPYQVAQNVDNWNSYYAKVAAYAQENMRNENGQDVFFGRGKGYNLGNIASDFLTRNLTDEEIYEKMKHFQDSEFYKTIYGPQGGMAGADYLRRQYAQMQYDLDIYEHVMIPAATTKVAGVVQLSDEVREVFKNYINEYGQYTAIASTTLGQQAVEHQNQIFSQALGFEEGQLPEEITLKMEPNQVVIRYDLSSTFASTNNIVCSYLGQAGFSYISYSTEKDLLKAKTNETMILYGFTLLAAIMMNLIVGILLVQNRLDRRKKRFQILIRTGADQQALVGMCMLESLRESIWCIFILPLTLCIHYLIYRSYMRRL